MLQNTPLLNIAGFKGLLSREPWEDDVTLKYEGTTWQDDQKCEGMTSAVTSFAGLAMLIGPLWILAYVHHTATRLGVISGFIVLFFSILSTVTTASLFQVLGACAAYSAVLTVFLQFNS
jgi:hypothetical protein